MTTLLTSDSEDLPITGDQQWGIFSNGTPVVVADSVTMFRFRKEYELLTYPVEQGAFETYNKVAKPFTPFLRMVTGGSTQDKQAFLDSIEAVVGDLNFYEVVTPEVTYSSVNFEMYDYDRTAARGNGLLAVDITLKEIRVTGTLNFSNTQTPNGVAPASLGTVQPQEASGAQTGALAGLQ